jgi:glycosyltransferase involved in cell wall biosynthesis
VLTTSTTLLAWFLKLAFIRCYRIMQEKVAFIIGSLSGGGAERVISNLSLHLNDEIERYIVVYNCEKIGYPYKGNLIKLKPCKKGEVKGWFQKIYYLYKYVNAIKKIRTQHGIQVWVSFLATPNIINLLSGSGGKKIVSVRDYTSREIRGLYSEVYACFLKVFYNNADAIVAVSKGVKADLVKNYGVNEKKVEVIYNPYDIESIQNSVNEAIGEKYRHLFKNQVIISVGRLMHLKGQRHLIRAFSKVKKQHNNAKLILLGSGELESELRMIINELNLENDIHLLGFQENPFKFIHNSTVFVLPSLTEGFPNALVEAMACSIPVISADCRAGPREILSPDSDYDKETSIIEYAPYGILVPTCDGKNHDAASPLTSQENILADSIIELLGDRDLREKYSLMAEKRANDFKIDNITPQWERLILRS